MDTATTIFYCMGFVTGLLFSFLIRIRLKVGTDLNQLINKRAYDLITKTLHQFDPITKLEDETATDDENNG